MNKKIKLLLLCIISLTLLFTKSNDVLAVECDTKTAEQLAKIIYHLKIQNYINALKIVNIIFNKQ